MRTQASDYRACCPVGKNRQMSCSGVMPLTARICPGPRDQELLVMKNSFKNKQLKCIKFFLVKNSHESIITRTHVWALTEQ